MALNIVRGRISRAQKVVIYGPEGIGKTTLAAAFPDPLFIDTEGGSDYIELARVNPAPDTWEKLQDTVKEVIADPSVCKTLVIDTMDWAEQMIIESVLRTRGLQSIEDAGYGKGYTYVGEEAAKFMGLLDQVKDAGIHMVLTAHAKMRKFEQPDEVGAYDRWEMKLSKQVAPLVKEWCDHLFFCNYRTIVVEMENKAKKAQGGKRVIYTSHRPVWDAKTRANLPEVLDMDYSSISELFADNVPKKKGRRETLADLMKQDSITEEDLVDLIHEKKLEPVDRTSLEAMPDDRIDWAIKWWHKLPEIIRNSKIKNKEEEANG
jgi:GTPase SAR1 family protein